MSYFQTTVRRALDRARRLPASLRRTGRWPLAFGTAAALIVSTLGPPAPVAAQPLEVARLQVVVQQVKIHDDREGFLSGEGEMKLTVDIWRCPDSVPLPCFGHRRSGFVAQGIADIDASTGDTVALDLQVPQPGDAVGSRGTSPETGFPVDPGARYVVEFSMEESDLEFSSAEDMGRWLHILDTGEHGLGLGTHTARSLQEGRVIPPGDFTITYEIRRAPVPDLKPSNIRVLDLLASANKLVCIGVANVELGDAGPFEVALYVDGVVPPAGRITAGHLASGTGGELCVEAQLPTTGQHQLKAVVDEQRAVIEFNEANNVFEQPYTAANATSSPAPVPSSAPAQTEALPDLTVSAIKVNGQVPDGKNDCKDGGNVVAVVVKNAGTVKADFVVRLVVDGNKIDTAVDGLDAGQEREIRFGDVRLKKGERTLVAIAGPENTTAESNEDNNELKVTVRCSAAD